MGQCNKDSGYVWDSITKIDSLLPKCPTFIKFTDYKTMFKKVFCLRRRFLSHPYAASVCPRGLFTFTVAVFEYGIDNICNARNFASISNVRKDNFIFGKKGTQVSLLKFVISKIHKGLKSKNKTKICKIAQIHT